MTDSNPGEGGTVGGAYAPSEGLNERDFVGMFSVVRGMNVST